MRPPTPSRGLGWPQAPAAATGSQPAQRGEEDTQLSVHVLVQHLPRQVAGHPDCLPPLPGWRHLCPACT